MRGRACRVGLAALAALLPGFASAEFTLRSEVDARKIGVQDQLQLTITVEGSGAPDEIPLPALANLDVAAGPYQSSLWLRMAPAPGNDYFL